MLQPTNYWKNASQNGMPFTLNPAILYRGVVANVINNGFCVMSQFYINGVLKKVLLGDEQRDLKDSEKMLCGVSAGVLSSVVCGPIELVMIQQQAKGGGLFSTFVDMVKAGPSTFFRGTTAQMGREGIYAGCFLGGMPIVREKIQAAFPDSIGATEDSARIAAAFSAGPICTALSHPPDTVKTCLQGDIEQVKYKGYGARRPRLRTARARIPLACPPTPHPVAQGPSLRPTAPGPARPRRLQARPRRRSSRSEGCRRCGRASRGACSARSSR